MATETAAAHSMLLTNGKRFTYSSNEATATEQIPCIDVSRMRSDSLADRKALAEEIRAAAHNIGFFCITNHGVPLGQAVDVIEQAKNFFAQPLATKMEVSTDLIPSEYCGYHAMERYNPNGRKKRDLYEAFNWNYNAARDPHYPDPTVPQINLWPANMPLVEETFTKYQTTVIRFARSLTRLFALALHLPETAFDAFIQRPEAGLRVLHYPQQTTHRDEQNGIGAHTDVEFFTIIACDTEGLEVLGKSGNWIKVKPVPGAFVVNIADCFMRLTNDFFVSTVHRVINESGKERYSVPFFWGFDRRTLLNPVETCVTAENPSRYELMTAGEYYEWRTKRQKVSWVKGEQEGVDK
ncbi:hypothetical protein BJY00DRAFT_110761 [Aspergillus carlsbadensis]|nr:hypothetical protein BJY00DRAFT_110761 [Aspergillus carlsbadensis]